jgi:GxxExxY protein
MHDILNKHSEILNNLSGKIIGLSMKVHSTLGVGFLESIYQQALISELIEHKIPFEVEKRIRVHYNNKVIGFFDADIVVDNKIIIEIKAVQGLVKAHEVQLVNYLAATKIDQGLLINFGAYSLEFKKKFRLAV